VPSLSILQHFLDKISGGSFQKVSYLEVIYSFAEAARAEWIDDDIAAEDTVAGKILCAFLVP
jgi:hypothetical protein